MALAARTTFARGTATVGGPTTVAQMGWFTTALRRLLWLLLIAGVGGAIWSWRRDAADASHPAPAEWPPLSTPNSSDAATDDSAVSDEETESTTAASFVNALVDAPEARSVDGASSGWTEPVDDGSCPISHPVKANDNSGIFHMPDGRFYARTRAGRCYSDADAALADGYREARH